jgi:hypothetical protein
MRFGHPR